MLGFACLLGFGPGSEPPLCRVNALPLSYTLALRFHRSFGHGIPLNYLLALNSLLVSSLQYFCLRSSQDYRSCGVGPVKTIFSKNGAGTADYLHAKE